ncbi:MAG: hypothetical protein GY820_09770 [Gammaproteobacteria bacterium]|nr:hypothetical protein [Gammaproteobacteria bacterium]
MGLLRTIRDISNAIFQCTDGSELKEVADAFNSGIYNDLELAVTGLNKEDVTKEYSEMLKILENKSNQNINKYNSREKVPSRLTESGLYSHNSNPSRDSKQSPGLTHEGPQTPNF